MSDQLTIETSVIECGPVECLGLHFNSEDARRAYFIETLRARLKDPEFRRIEGFPIGSDEDILRMSDPPYYTACPNPFIEDFIRCYGKPYDPTILYDRKPSAVDVSEGKNDPMYAAHGYHTKVPHKAIMRAILHYTEPGDLVLDGFSGSGMTGVAARLCDHPEPEFRKQLEDDWKTSGDRALKWGPRRTVLGDLAPAATFIAANYNLPFDVAVFQKKLRQMLNELRAEVGWMYETAHKGGRKGFINFTVWSELFSCPECNNEVVFFDHAVDKDSDAVKAEFPCPHCSSLLKKSSMDRLHETYLDRGSGKLCKRPKRKPVLINYSLDGEKHEKIPDKADLELLDRIQGLPFPPGFPTDRMMHTPQESECWGDKWRAGTAAFSHIHHLFLARTVHALGRLWEMANQIPESRVRAMICFTAEQAIWSMSVLNRYRPTGYSQVSQYLTGVYYVASQHSECSPWYILDGKGKRLVSSFRGAPTTRNQAIVTTGTAARIGARQTRSTTYSPIHHSAIT